MPPDLLERWAALVPHARAAAAGRALLDRWAEPHRRYHGVAHLREVLDLVDELAPFAADPDAVRLAAFFHDAVYNPESTDNEQRSAELAATVLAGLDLDPARVRTVERVVRATQTHLPTSVATDEAVLCDADLAVLAASPDDYAAYASGVREEYGHLSDADFRAGRTVVLERLLQRPQLFATVAGRERWEERARHNLAVELTLLRAGD